MFIHFNHKEQQMTYTNILWTTLLTSTLLLADTADDTHVSKKVYSEQNWGIGVALRSGSIPYGTEDDVVSSFVPMLFFENEYLFLHGLESGL